MRRLVAAFAFDRKALTSQRTPNFAFQTRPVLCRLLASSLNVEMRRFQIKSSYAPFVLLAGLLVFFPIATARVSTVPVVPRTAQTTLPPKPKPAQARFRGLIGEYGPDEKVLIIFEQDGQLRAHHDRAERERLNEISKDVFKSDSSAPGYDIFVFSRDARGRATQVTIDGLALKRRQIEPDSGNQLRIKPVRPVAELMKEALAAQPPEESGDFLPADLVELTKLDPTIRLEIRYATTNNFLGTKFYSQARAFMQRPAAEAVVRANRKLKPFGYGLLVHDAYRPWYVTKVFWDATPADKKIFVADPAKGSRHNRGCAVDLTLYDLRTKRPVEMVSTYDETTARAYPDYPGGTSLQRWHRKLLREAMEAEGFTVYNAEWWHFDYKDWNRYRIGNVRFEAIK